MALTDPYDRTQIITDQFFLLLFLSDGLIGRSGSQSVVPNAIEQHDDESHQDEDYYDQY
jgi:hypothetical protein